MGREKRGTQSLAGAQRGDTGTLLEKGIWGGHSRQTEGT